MVSRARARRGFSLVEVLIVLAILSGSLMVVFQLLQSTARSTRFNRDHIIAWQLLANMFERYHLMDPRLLLKMFGAGQGAAELEADPVLNSDQALTTAELRALGIRRDAYFKKISGSPDHGVLYLIVTWKGLDGRPHSLADAVVTTEERPPGPPRLPPRIDRASGPSAAVAGTGGEPAGETGLALSGEHPLVRALRTRDASDGQVDVLWPHLSAEMPLPRVVSVVVDLLHRQAIPDGIYHYEWETLGPDTAASFGVLGQGASVTIMDLREPGGKVHLMLREEYPPRAAGQGAVRLLDGTPLASRDDHMVLRSVSNATGLAAPRGSPAHVDATPSRMLVYRTRVDTAGRDVPFGQTLELRSLSAKVVEAITRERLRDGNARSRLERHLEELIVKVGLDVRPLAFDPDSRSRLGW